jgi:hypothetical protein
MPYPNELAPLTVTPGAIRFNTDSMKLEYYRGGPVGFGTTTQTGEWVNLTTDSPDIQTGGARGLFSNGYTGSSRVDTIDYINIDSTGNAIDFGNSTVSVNARGGGTSSRTRACFHGGFSPTYTDVIDFVTISSTGDATDFGNCLSTIIYAGGVSNSTRGIICGGYAPASPTIVNTMQYITIAQTGDSVDFGDLSTAITSSPGECASSTRGIIAGGYNGSDRANNIQFITISTLGNAGDFGDLTTKRAGMSGCSNSVRGVFSAGEVSPNVNTMDYITIATLGNAIDFGDAQRVAQYFAACASSTRGCYSMAEGSSPIGVVSDIDYIQFASVGNAIDFGDLSQARVAGGAGSNGHGGLG